MDVQPRNPHQVTDDRAEYLELLVLLSEATAALIDESNCWVSDDSTRCKQCQWCEVAHLVDRIRATLDG